MQALLDLLLPPRCGGCGREGQALCASCRGPLARRMAERAGIPIGLLSTQPGGLVQLEWCSSFTGPARACLHTLKYDGERRLVEPLGGLMAERWRAAGIGGDLLAAVPVHAQRRRERGFDQAELLAREVGRCLGLHFAPVLERAARTSAQHQLGRTARAGNVGGAFTVTERRRALVTGRWVIVIDDVMTTGATLNACATALVDAGATAVSALTLARER
jgi:ComF family protein